MRIRPLRAVSIALLAAVAVTAASCGGGAGGSGNDAMVLRGFNLPNIAGVAVDQPLVFTFSDPVDPASVTPDTIQVNGPAGAGFTFESIVVDGNLVAFLPRIPTRKDYTDCGLTKGTTYTVVLPVFPAVDTVRSKSGRPLLKAESFSFSTTPAVTFVEPRRPLVHAPGPISGPGAQGDEDGCVQNVGNELFDGTFQAGTDEDAVLLCIKNEGPPHVLNQNCSPKHDQRAVGTPSAAQPGLIDLPAIRVRFNEPVDPNTAVPYNTSTKLSLNVQLWRVGDTDAIPLPTPEQIQVVEPVVVQDTSTSEVILSAIGPQKQGTYIVNVTGVRDLSGAAGGGNTVVTNDRPNPSVGGYAGIEPGLVGKVAPGWRLYFRTLELGTLAGSITENFGDNFDERTKDTFTSSTATNPIVNIVGSPPAGGPGYTLTLAEPGQATTANWNGTRRFMGRAGLVPNNQLDSGGGVLKACFEPFLGNGGDGTLVVSGTTTLSSNGTDGNGDGVWEFENLTVNVGATLKLVGPKPVVILVRGSLVVNGTIDASGADGGIGIDTDGTVRYSGSGALPISGAGGVGGPGAGAGGHGAPTASGLAVGGSGAGAVDIWGNTFVAGRGTFGANSDGSPQGGGGGGFGSGGSGGSGATNGGTYNSADFARAFASFANDRDYEPNTGISGGSGGGGGGADDDNGTSETGDGSFPFADGIDESGGDDGGGGGGGGGGAVWIIGDSISVAAGGKILANGGKGGSTFGPGDQILVDPDPDPSHTGDERIVGVTDPNALVCSGSGGGGGGGSGGAILLQARAALTVAGTVSAVGGAGGKTLGNAHDGATGGDGRIAFMSFQGSTDSGAGSISISGSTPAAGVSSASYQPTTDLVSQGVSLWFDQVTTTATYGAPPVDDDNFAALTASGLTRGVGGDFEAILEFQGADTLSPTFDVQNATSGTGITAWTPTIAAMNGKRFFRFRWRFFVARKDALPGNDPDFDPTVHPMPQLLSFTVPFSK